MSTATKEVINLMEILPESEQMFALEIIKKLVRIGYLNLNKKFCLELLVLDSFYNLVILNENLEILFI